jgi:hypothetical protein
MSCPSNYWGSTRKSTPGRMISGKTDYTDLFEDGAEKLKLPPG